MEVQRFVLGSFATNTYLLTNNDECLLIDPASKADKLFDYLENEFFANIESLHINSEEAKIANSIKEHLTEDYLIDYYDCFEALDNVYQNMIGDLEIVKEQGFGAARIIDEVKVLKKDTKTKKLEEKVVGYDGRLIPFSLIQKVYFDDSLIKVTSFANDLSSLDAEKSDLLNSIDPNDKEELIKENSEDIDSKKLKSKIVEIKKQQKRGAEFDEDSYENILLKIDGINEKTKSIKKDLKSSKESLEELTKNKIMNLSDDEIHNLLIDKWVNPICNNINDLSFKLIKGFEKNIKLLCKKYETTYLELDKQIKETETSLGAMVDELEANEFDKKGLDEFKKLLGGK